MLLKAEIKPIEPGPDNSGGGKSSSLSSYIMECKVKKLNLYYYMLIFYVFANQGVYANTQNLVVYTYDSFTADWGPAPKIKEKFEKYYRQIKI